MIHLDEDTSDALAEAFNLALGEAAASFAEIVQEEIVMTVPVVELLPRTELVSRLQLLPREGSSPGGKLCSIAQRFDRQQGGLSTEALLLFGEQGSLEIVRRMLGQHDMPLEHITELEQDALGEVGNIIINSCMNTLSGIFGTEMIGSLPDVLQASADNLFDGHQAGQVVLMVRIGMGLQSHDITGYVLFLMDMPSLQTGIEQIRNFFALDAQPA
jgi:chemotaxis protein CheC